MRNEVILPSRLREGLGVGQSMKEPSFRPRNTQRTRKLRNEATPAERRLWQYLSKSQINGNKFTRQYEIGPFIVDFVCRKKKLVIELDGFSHDSRQSYDARRTAFLEKDGYSVIRFNNDDVFQNLDGVVVMIEQALAKMPTPNPSRKREGDT